MTIARKGLDLSEVTETWPLPTPSSVLPAACRLPPAVCLEPSRREGRVGLAEPVGRRFGATTVALSGTVIN